jgi:hypothetical protein
MRAVFPSVYLLDVPSFSNTEIYGTTEPITTADIQHNLSLASEPLVQEVAASAENQGDIRASTYHGQVFTDDLAPVERLIDEIIFGFINGQH